MTTVQLTFDKIKELVAHGVSIGNLETSLKLLMEFAGKMDEYINGLGIIEEGVLTLTTPDYTEESEFWEAMLPVKHGYQIKLRLGKKSRDKLFGHLIGDCMVFGEGEPLSFEERARPLLEVAKKHYQSVPNKESFEGINYAEQIAEITRILK